MATGDAIVAVSGVTRAYGTKIAVDHANLTLPRGRILALLGASGSGKSTLLRLIAGLEPVDGGGIQIEGEVVSSPGLTVAPEERRVGIVFQDFALFPHLTVSQNVGFGLKGQSRTTRKSKVSDLLKRLGLADRAGAWPHHLSGGEQQRVALARAMARDPAVILLDEPFSSLDGPLRADIRDDLMLTLRENGTSAIVVTHDAEDAMVIADELVLMDQGRMIQSGSPQSCYLYPTSIAAARLLGPINLVPAEVMNGAATSMLGRAASDVPNGLAWMGARPNDLTLGATDGAVTGRVASIAFSGAFWVVKVNVGEVSILLHVMGTAPSIGETVFVAAAPECLVVLPIAAPNNPS